MEEYYLFRLSRFACYAGAATHIEVRRTSKDWSRFTSLVPLAPAVSSLEAWQRALRPLAEPGSNFRQRGYGSFGFKRALVFRNGQRMCLERVMDDFYTIAWELWQKHGLRKAYDILQEYGVRRHVVQIEEHTRTRLITLKWPHGYPPEAHQAARTLQMAWRYRPGGPEFARLQAHFESAASESQA